MLTLFLSRLIRVARLDSSIYAELKDDKVATCVIATRLVFGLGLAKSIALVALVGVVTIPIVGSATMATLQALEWLGVR